MQQDHVQNNINQLKEDIKPIIKGTLAWQYEQKHLKKNNKVVTSIATQVANVKKNKLTKYDNKTFNDIGVIELNEEEFYIDRNKKRIKLYKEAEIIKDESIPNNEIIETKPSKQQTTTTLLLNKINWIHKQQEIAWRKELKKQQVLKIMEREFGIPQKPKQQIKIRVY